MISATPDQVVLSAPLAPNINHRETVFGGSASALATLSAWTLLHTRLAGAGFGCTVVIRRSIVTYDKAITCDFTASAIAPSSEAWQRLIRALQRKGRGRITISSVFVQNGRAAGQFEGDFVALGVGSL